MFSLVFFVILNLIVFILICSFVWRVLDKTNDFFVKYRGLRKRVDIEIQRLFIYEIFTCFLSIISICYVISYSEKLSRLLATNLLGSTLIFIGICCIQLFAFLNEKLNVRVED